MERWLHTFPRPAGGQALVLAGYPAPYRVGMSNLGYHFLIRRLKESPILRLERFFSDTAPRTLESGARISSASVIFVSISYEEDYLNLVRILRQAGVPPLRNERHTGPLIIAGGPAPSANPYPLSDIVDCCVLGEGERSLDDIVGIIERGPRAGSETVLEAIAGLPAAFVPAVSVGAAYPPPVGPVDFPHSIVVTPKAVFPDTLLIEIGRGCPGSCTFCLASVLYRPYRAMPVDDLEHLLDTITVLPATAGLVSTAVAAHPQFDRVMRACTERGMRVALGSMRAEDLDDGKVELIGRAGTRSVSFAPESGGEQLRFHLGKHVPDETYLRAARALRGAGVRNFKLYLLIGCPGETDRDLDETGVFIRAFSEAARGCRVSVNVNVVVPKAWTPMQFHAMPSERELGERMKRLKRICRGRGIAVRTKSVRSALRQAVLSVGDARAGRAVVRYAEGGTSWKRALEEAGVNPAMPHETRGLDGYLPWDAIAGPVNRKAIEQRYRLLVTPRRGPRNRT